MRIIGRAAFQHNSRRRLGRLALLCATAASLAVQSAMGQGGAAAAESSPAAVRAVLDLDGPWRFQIGDDPRWADPALDDSQWTAVSLSKPLSEQGIDSYSGYAWYRLRLAPGQLGSAAQALLVTGNSAGQIAVYVNGVEAGHSRGGTGRPSMYELPPFSVPLAGGATGGPVVIAVRTWAGPEVPIHRGLLTRVEAGTAAEMADRLAMATARQWDEQGMAAMAMGFLFLCVAVLGFALYFAQRHHAEYLWLALLGLSVAAGSAAEMAFGLAWIPLNAYRIFSWFFNGVFIAVMLEFVLRFTATRAGRSVRALQGAALALPFVYLAQWQAANEVLSASAEMAFCVLVCALLFRAWRGGRTDAGVMLLPFLLAALADSADSVLGFAAGRHWLAEQLAAPRFHLGPIVYRVGTIAYLIFFASLIAVILYRFIRVSQDEQRAHAEVAAARSVQALLIPTELPSNRNFMLESAYLPVNGVGGDFFQVLPLEDESMLIVVGDVSGKGLQAAMNSSTLVGALRNELSHDPATVLEHLNRVLLGAVRGPGASAETDAAPCFATCLCARIYPYGRLTIANAGHLSPYRDGREMELLPSLPLGVVAGSHYEQQEFQLNRGDRLVLLSDGVVEATNAEGELFGFERTQQVSHEPARYIAQTAKHFGQTDDITVVSIYLASAAAGHEQDEPARAD